MWVAKALGMIVSTRSRPHASARLNPKICSAAALNSRMRPSWLTVTMASSAASKTAERLSTPSGMSCES